MLDLSFLTEEEYGKLMKVLQRDAELKKKDGDRIRLEGSLKDEKKKKFVTGQWFHEVKAQRFQEGLEGSELLRASIKKKKSNSDRESNEHVPESPEDRESSLPPEATVLSSAISEEERSREPSLDSAEGHRSKPKPRLRLSTLPSSAEKRSSLEDISPADSGVGISPFLVTRSNSQGYGKGHEIPSAISTKLSEKDLDDFSYSTGGDVADAPSESRTFLPVPQEEFSPSSKIPVKKVSNKGPFQPSTVIANGAENPEFGLAKSSKLPTLDWENGCSVKQGANYTISSSNNKDEAIGLDREHFKNLKSFWEKGGEPLLANDVSEISAEKASTTEVNGRPSKLNRPLSAQSNNSQNGDDKVTSNIHPKARIPYRKPVTLSSSEDEPTYVAPPRKGSGSAIPRSTYGRSKGAMTNRNSLSDGNGKQSPVEEEKKVPRCTRRSKLPIRVPSVKIEAPAKERTGIIFEPETPADEFVMADESKRKTDSLAGRVQILIDSVSSEDVDKVGSTVEISSDLGFQDNLEMVKKQLKDGPSSLAEDPLQNEAVDERGVAPEVDSSMLSEGNEHHSPAAKKLIRANGYSLAKSMVNIYTTTETYTKPQVPNHQYLEPERAKDFRKSTPLLLSETESDTASEISFQFSRHKKTPSVGSHSSDMASVSSVSGSVLSVYSGDFGSVDAKGHVQFALDYDEKNREFQIFVSQCKDLAIVDEKKGRTDPYVKTYLLPDKARMGKRKTSVKKRTVNPIFSEVLRYKIEKMVLLIQKLNLSIWHNDPLGRNSFLGEVEIDLASWDWQNNKLNWYMLKPRILSAINHVDHRGVMNLSIRYIPPSSPAHKSPASGEVHIWVKDTKDLPQLRPSGVDSFVKCYVLPDTSKKSYQKTRIVKRDSNPVFNHTIVYDGFHTEDLKDACVELTVWDHEKLTNHFLGGIRLGLGTGSSYGIAVDWMDSTQEEVAFWQEMMMTPNVWIEGSLPLRSLAGKKKFK
ncbi:synaptotagmin-like protein 2 isoform X2 [Zootoca vivipara]|uniref:synaptotagmin-like protein 2 isoform X2 n=1 Tax=Zootoca vivipara TaxID=8524 RepID=UPI0015914127|nr:synaptotagmin-like protein 2 isoform X2 [Zootoca vivipara]